MEQPIYVLIATHPCDDDILEWYFNKDLTKLVCIVRDKRIRWPCFYKTDKDGNLYELEDLNKSPATLEKKARKYEVFPSARAKIQCSGNAKIQGIRNVKARNYHFCLKCNKVMLTRSQNCPQCKKNPNKPQVKRRVEINCPFPSD